MNLIIDIGNSATKLSYFEDMNMVYNVTIFHHNIANFGKLIENQHNSQVKMAYIGSVKPSLNNKVADIIKTKLGVDVHIIQQRNVITKLHDNGLDLESLGLDLAAITLYLTNTYKNAIIIINGTALVAVEVLDGAVNNLWLTPGQYSLKKALFEDAELISEEKDSLNIIPSIGKELTSTQTAINQGVELIQSAFIKELESRFPKHTLIYSGPKNISLPERTIIRDGLTSIAYNYITSKKIM